VHHSNSITIQGFVVQDLAMRAKGFRRRSPSGVTILPKGRNEFAGLDPLDVLAVIEVLAYGPSTDPFDG